MECKTFYSFKACIQPKSYTLTSLQFLLSKSFQTETIFRREKCTTSSSPHKLSIITIFYFQLCFWTQNISYLKVINMINFGSAPWRDPSTFLSWTEMERIPITMILANLLSVDTFAICEFTPNTEVDSRILECKSICFILDLQENLWKLSIILGLYFICRYCSSEGQAHNSILNAN